MPRCAAKTATAGATCNHEWGPFTRSDDGTWHRQRACRRSPPLSIGSFPLFRRGDEGAMQGAGKAEPTATAASRGEHDVYAVWQPVVCHDKHRAAFNALHAVGLASILDDWHDYKSVDKQCSELRITGAGAKAAQWSMRLLKRT